MNRREFLIGGSAAVVVLHPVTTSALPPNWPTALRNVLRSEGGYSNHPADPGGVTLNGVIQRQYNRYRDDMGLPRRPLTRAMVGTAEWLSERDDIYRRYYGNPLGFDGLPGGVDYCVFDYGVNSGIGRAPKILQRILGVEVDGRIGPETLEAAAKRDARQLVSAVCDERMRFLRQLRTWPTFGTGWRRRVNAVRTISLRMATPGRRGSADQVRAPLGAGASFQLIRTRNGVFGEYQLIRPAHDPDEQEEVFE